MENEDVKADHALEVAAVVAELPQQANAREIFRQLRDEVRARGGKLWNLISYMATHPAAVAKLFADAASGNYTQAIADFIEDWQLANPATAPQG